MTAQPVDSPVFLDDYDEPRRFHLWVEVEDTRDVLEGLMMLWEQQLPSLTIDDARRLSVLVFNGVRTVAILLTHQLRLNPNAANANMEWLDKALEQLGEDMGIEL